MPSCTVRRGFLTLRQCGAPASALCSVCGRPTCAEHLTGGAAGPLCVECSARQTLSDDPDTGYVGDSGPTDTWRIGYRDSFYRETGYSPRTAGGFVTGGTLGTFDELDKAPFDRTLADAGFPSDDDGGPSLFDS